MHRCPGYTVARPREEHDLFTDPEAQRVCAQHWAYFAKRWKGIPNEALVVGMVADILFAFAVAPLDQAMLQVELVMEADRQGELNKAALQK